MGPKQATAQQRTTNWLAAITTFLLAGLLPVAAWQSEGSLSAQRIMVDLVMPIGFAWLGSLFLSIRFWRLQQRSSAAFCTFLFLTITVLFNPWLNRLFMQQVEGPVPETSPLDLTATTFRAVVVLGGGASLGRDGRAQLNTNGQRIATAAQMWHAKKVETIICTGEDNFIAGPIPEDSAAQDQRDLWNPARAGIELLVSLGVPRARIYRIGGINTAIEMKELKSFLEHPPLTFPTVGEVGLLTSAFHMHRAMRLAEGQGLSLRPIPVAYQTAPYEPLAVGDFVPNVAAGGQFYTALRECLARLVGR